MDRISPSKRSQNMARIKGINTRPEFVVRRALRALGVGYRLHVKSLPGKPDIVMQGRHKIIEVRGCFWHRHRDCKFAYTPKSNKAFWNTKLNRNVQRDKQNLCALQNRGWDVLVIWECETKDANALICLLESFIRRKGSQSEKASRKEHFAKA